MKQERSGLVRRDLARSAQFLLRVAFGHSYRVLVLLFGDSILLELGVALGGRHVDDFVQKDGGYDVSDRGSLAPVDMKARIIAAHASGRIIGNAGRRRVLAHRLAEFPFMLAIVPGF
jgi:hypothetical protein